MATKRSFTDQRIFIEHGEEAFKDTTFSVMTANHPYGYRAIICPSCEGACLWGDGDPAKCEICRGRGVVVLRFSSL